MQKNIEFLHGSAGPGQTYITGPSFQDFQGPNKAITGQELIMVLYKALFPWGGGGGVGIGGVH